MSSLGSVRKNIRKPVPRAPRPDPIASNVADAIIEEVRAEMGATTKVAPHPQKYPNHEFADKGSVYAGICNRTACRGFPALYYNRVTYGYYCIPCGRAINGNNPNALCIKVTHDLSHEEMNQHNANLYSSSGDSDGH